MPPIHNDEVKRVGLFGAEKRAMASRNVKAQTALRRFGPGAIVAIGALAALVAAVFAC